MKLEVRQVTEVTDSLLEAFGRLMPQLSPRLAAPSAARLREIAALDAMAKTLRRRVELLEQELRSTAQRVNLFEKGKIPEAKENIRVIGIYLGDQQTSAVVRGKIAKKKLQEVSQ